MEEAGDVENGGGAPEEMQVYLSKSMYDGMRSTLMDLYRRSDIVMNEKFGEVIITVHKGTEEGSCRRQEKVR